MDWPTILIGILVIVIGIGAYIWQLSNVFFTRIQWYSPFDKTVLITGCDTGIGLQLAQHFYRKGCYVIATVLTVDGKGAKELKKLAEDKQRMLVIKMDVTKESDVSEASVKVGKHLRDNGFEGMSDRRAIDCNVFGLKIAMIGVFHKLLLFSYHRLCFRCFL